MAAVWELVLQAMEKLSPGQLLVSGVLGLLAATQGVILVLNKLERHQFGPVFLGTLITPLCTGFPNLMIGLFGQERLQGDLVLRLNMGNNIANTTLVTGLIALIAGPLTIRPGKGRSQKAKRANHDQIIALAFFWLGAAALLMLARDGQVTLSDGLGLCALYLLYQIVSFQRRGKVAKKKRLTWLGGLFIVIVLAVAALLIQGSVTLIGKSLEHFGGRFPALDLGMFLGLLTVIPESFLLLRLALRQGSLGFSGLVGDCLVSIPLVIGLSAVFHPFATSPVAHLSSPSVWPYLHLFGAMAAFTLISFQKKNLSRKQGLLLMGLYAIVWWHSQH